MTEQITIDRRAAAASAAPVLDIRRDEGFFRFDAAACAEAGKALRANYANAEPFPHIILDDFLDKDVLRQVVTEFPKPVDGRFSDAFSQKKTGYKLDMIRSAYIVDLLNALNSAAFVDFLENLTGIDRLVTDHRFAGGGLHETRRGGHLSIHADFNIHPRTKLQRRLNLILFLNEEWDPNWGGALELWDKSMTRQAKSAVPELGRAVIFNTDSDSYHGHPSPLDCPPEVTRKSIALYYYRVPPAFVIPHTTVFRGRPGSADANTSLINRLTQSAKMMFGKPPAD